MLPPESTRAGRVQLIHMLTLSMNKNILGSSLKGTSFRKNSYELHLKKNFTNRDPKRVLGAEGHTDFPQQAASLTASLPLQCVVLEHGPHSFPYTTHLCEAQAGPKDTCTQRGTLCFFFKRGDYSSFPVQAFFTWPSISETGF